MLAWGKALYVDDFVSAEAYRGLGYGSALFDWLLVQATQSGCDQLHLDSGVHRFAAHRFYLHKGMDITSHHFAMKIKKSDPQPGVRVTPT
jgi:GNAT superfamily N-acetyltransferase